MQRLLRTRDVAETAAVRARHRAPHSGRTEGRRGPGHSRRRPAARDAALRRGGHDPTCHAEVLGLAAALQAPIVPAMRGKEFLDYDNPYDVGMTGLLGFTSGYQAME